MSGFTGECRVVFVGWVEISSRVSRGEEEHPGSSAHIGAGSYGGGNTSIPRGDIPLGRARSSLRAANPAQCGVSGTARPTTLSIINHQSPITNHPSPINTMRTK